MILPGFPKMMPMLAEGVIPIFRGVETNSTDSGTSLTINKPAGTVEGDLMIAVFTCGTVGRTLTLPSGWALERAETETYASLFIASKVAGPSEPSSYNFSVNSGNINSCHILTYEFADDVEPIGVVSIVGMETVTAPSITPTQDGVLLAIYAAAAMSAAIDAGPSGMTQRSFIPINCPSAIYELSPSPIGATGGKTLVWTTIQATKGILAQLIG